jgi:hypothetical protein
MPDTDGIALLTSLIDAALRLAAEHRQFVGALIRCGLIDDHTRAVLTARLDQLDAVTTDLQARRALLNSGSGSRLPGEPLAPLLR